MNKQWILGLVLLSTPAWGLADDSMKGMDMSGITTPAATAQATPVAAHKKMKKKKKTKKTATEKMPLSKGEGKAAPDKSTSVAVKAKKQRWVCPMDGYVSDHPGKCPRCGMDLVLEKDEDAPAAKP